MAGRDTNFYYSFLVLPPEKRHAIVAVWDFCRAVDDSTDEVANGDCERAARGLARWRAELAACYDGGVPQTRQGQALAPLVRRFGLPREAFDALIEGVEMDIAPRPYETFDDLYQYCIRVASAVGLICLEIFGYRDPGSKQYATDLGVALQLTNILRDLAEDAARGRLYLPRELLEQHRIGVAEPLRVLRDPRLPKVCDAMAALARERFVAAERRFEPRDRRALRPALVMMHLYRRTLDRLLARGWAHLEAPVHLAKPERLWLALRYGLL